jgi:hypothetical protein
VKYGIQEYTDQVNLQLAARKADTLENLFDLDHESRVKDWPSELNVSKVAGTFGHAFQTGLAFKVAIDGYC